MNSKLFYDLMYKEGYKYQIVLPWPIAMIFNQFMISIPDDVQLKLKDQ